MHRRLLPIVALITLLTGGLLAAPAGAQPALRTASGLTTICTAQGFESTGTFPRLATTTPVVVQTGELPVSGPGLPVSQLTGATGEVGGGQQGYRFRAFDQDGASVAARPNAGNCYRYSFHASVPVVDAAHAAGAALVTTDGSGFANVQFPGTLSAAPVSVVVTGRSPYSGPGLPLNLLTTGYSATGFVVRALDQAGAPIANHGIRLHYWATTQRLTPNTRAGVALVTPDSRGIGSITWPQFAVGLPPVAVILTGTSPTSGPGLPVNLLAFTHLSTGASIRILDQNGAPVTSPVRVAFYATKAPTS
jgi:hypothetical protein